jgi:hypothetical protein
MTKLCSRCGTHIPFIASRCPNCTSELGGSGGGDGAGALVFVFLVVVVGIGNCLGCIK